MGARTVRKDDSASPSDTRAKMTAATRRVGRIPQASARMPASGAPMTMTARFVTVPGLVDTGLGSLGQ